MQDALRGAGSAQIKFDEISPDMAEFSLSRGPLGTPHLMRWSAATENWHKIHYDAPFATEHDKLPGLLVNGSLKQQFILQLLKDWAGPQGFVRTVSFQFRAMTLVGDTLQIWARVTAVRRLRDYGLVELDIGIRNGDGKETTPGKAVIALPFTGGRPVPYPYDRSLEVEQA